MFVPKTSRSLNFQEKNPALNKHLLQIFPRLWEFFSLEHNFDKLCCEKVLSQVSRCFTILDGNKSYKKSLKRHALGIFVSEYPKGFTVLYWNESFDIYLGVFPTKNSWYPNVFLNTKNALSPSDTGETLFTLRKDYCRFPKCMSDVRIASKFTLVYGVKIVNTKVSSNRCFNCSHLTRKQNGKFDNLLCDFPSSQCVPSLALRNQDCVATWL